MKAVNNVRGFTLIELLVVISIIGLLIALLMPALASARTTSHMVQSLANERQITTAVLLYAEDSNSSVPFSLTGGNPSTNPATIISATTPSWPYMLFNKGYVAAIEVYWSPARNLINMDFAAMRTSPNHAQSYWLYPGYAANSEVMTTIAEASPQWQATYFSNTYPNGITPTKINEAKTPPPDRLLLLCDAWNNSTAFTRGISGFYKITPMTIFTPGNSVNFLPFNYNGAVPTSYLDGHAIADNGASIGWSTSRTSPSGASVITFPASPINSYSGNWTWTSTIAQKTSVWAYQYRK